MASLDKLAIRGIRSFDDKQVNVIQFYSPVTLLVGTNGSGKTTIIECLKYATTGELPPNTKGGAFVHDPKIAGEKEVKAQVRLRFWNVKRERMTATRNLQVTVKKGGGLTMKTLEGLLAKNDGVDTGERRNAISTKCAEMDIEVPRLMGVSTAILDNVIFCHQEESNWPLAEPSALKKKFDDIFEASKFTKALDHIRVLRKERVAELKIDNERLIFLTQDKNKAERLKGEIDAQKKALAKKERESEELQEEVAELTKTNQDFYQKASKFTEIFDQVNNLEQQKKMQKENMEALQKHIQILKESDEELSAMEANFSKNNSELKAKREDKTKLLNQYQSQLQQKRLALGKTQTMVGQYKADRKRYDRNVQQRVAIIRDQALHLDIPGYDSATLNEDQIAEFAEMLRENISRYKGDAQRIRDAGEKTDETINSEINQLNSQVMSNKSIKESKLNSVASTSAQIRDLTDELESAGTIDVDVKNWEREIASLEQILSTVTKDIAEAKFDDRNRDLQTKSRVVEAQRSDLEQELSKLHSQAEDRARLSVKRDDLASKQRELDEILVSVSDRYQELLGKKIDAEEMEESVAESVKTKEDELKKATDHRNTVSAQQSRNKAEVDGKGATIRELELEQSRLDKRIQDGIKAIIPESDSIESALSDVAEEIQDRDGVIYLYEGQAKLYTSMLKIAQKEHVCSGCNRGLDPAELQAVEAFMTGKVKGASKQQQKIAEIKQELEEWKQAESDLRALQPLAVRCREIQQDILPKAKEDLASLKDHASEIETEFEVARANEAKVQNTLRDLINFKSKAMLVTRTLHDVSETKNDVLSLERQLATTGSMKTITDVQREIKALTEELKVIERERQALLSDKEQQYNRLRSTESQKQNRQLNLADANAKLSRRRQNERSLAEHRSVLESLEVEIKEIDRAYDSIDQSLKQANDRFKNSRAKWSAEYSAANEKQETFVSAKDELDAITKDIKAYENQNGDKKLAEVESEAKEISRQITGLENDVQSIGNEISKLSDQISQAQSRQKNIAENIRYRQSQTEISRIEAEIATHDLQEAHRAKRQFDSKWAAYEKERSDKHGKHQQLVGEISQMKESLRRMTAQMKNDYANVQAEYAECKLKTAASSAANGDLEKYGKALDNAIMKYHTLKMEEINDNIQYLWNKTYQGTDIDTIRIRSDHDEGSTTARKIYNYRVVMVKDTVELDMRGRCSAGQKVLASIIIRLALADSFGQNCGVLALDEPTTNLDQENIDALAVALADIIEERRKQSNFQLIIITHDEGFLQKLASHDVFEFYWRVYRDRDQKSVVERQRVIVQP